MTESLSIVGSVVAAEKRVPPDHQNIDPLPSSSTSPAKLNEQLINQCGVRDISLTKPF
ncbi:7091_t:CDS:2 [Funneliformis caledonium]|uniref:7091_t:CDS:1 n=1 Tax=Funneliformis caledonium TaxID=1117310 RepID=A0A9N9DYG9_9GLOM|nr:7091_t:CDS:2 [Funneliformis caledonium]